MERHALAVDALNTRAFYFTALCPRLRDIVRFFYDAWDHPSMELMCKIINEKHFPQREACPAANMTQNHIPEFVRGEELMIDIKVWATNSKALKHRRAFDKYTGALTAINMGTRFKLGKPLKSHKPLKVALEELCVEVHGAGHTLKVMRIELWTAPIRT